MRRCGKGGSHTHIWWIKVWEEYLGSKGTQPHTRPPSPGYQCQEEKPPELLAVKTSGIEVGGKQLLDSLAVPLTGPKVNLLRHIPLSSSTTGVAAWKAPVAYREEMKYLSSGQDLGDSSLPDRKVGRGHCCFFEPSPHRATQPAGRDHIWDSITWLTLFAPSRCLSKTPPHTTYRPTPKPVFLAKWPQAWH